MVTYVKNARQVATVAQGFEPKPADTANLLADALAYTLHQARLSPDDAIARLRDSLETIEAAQAQGRATTDATAATFMAADCTTSSGDSC